MFSSRIFGYGRSRHCQGIKLQFCFGRIRRMDDDGSMRNWGHLIDHNSLKSNNLGHSLQLLSSSANHGENNNKPHLFFSSGTSMTFDPGPNVPTTMGFNMRDQIWPTMHAYRDHNTSSSNLNPNPNSHHSTATHHVNGSITQFYEPTITDSNSTTSQTLQIANPNSVSFLPENNPLADFIDNSKKKKKKKKTLGEAPLLKQLKTKKPKKEASSSSHGKKERNKDNEMERILINGIEIDLAKIPTPVCSCTGVPQQCYRWGVGGWQSACCTNTISMYPLPLSDKRRGARIAGRKMSLGAFRKVLAKIVGEEGSDLSKPIDLRNFWAKHGTNKFVTIR